MSIQLETPSVELCHWYLVGDIPPEGIEPSTIPNEAPKHIALLLSLIVLEVMAELICRATSALSAFGAVQNSVLSVSTNAFTSLPSTF